MPTTIEKTIRLSLNNELLKQDGKVLIEEKMINGLIRAVQ